ncbi:hypothetical protein GGX14DRAFT_403168 [Mycena pura]|uniref:Uncharacterized protein n=1 Tax=Mycena pura TaxID=153505 RepID=A0AAD6UXA6_9AGAR|nr:hypothetical protein GGX14DRAFT_403168 [Mycena pura]
MRTILLFAVFVHVTQALVFKLPSTSTTPGPFTITYQNEASDPAGKMTIWYGHPNGAGADLIAAQNVTHANTPTQLQVNISETAVDGLQWQFFAAPVGNVIAANDPTRLSPGNFFATSATFFIHAASSSAQTPAPSAPVVSKPKPRKSSPSVGLIVGVTFAATAAFALALGLLLFCVRRRRRARHRVKELEIEPAWADSAVSPATANAVTIEPYIAASSYTTPSQAMADAGAMAVSGSKAAAERQAYLTNQLAAVQAQLAALSFKGGDGETASARSMSTPATPGVSDSPSLDGHADAPSAELREQNAALHARIGMLEEQLQSQWAQGLSDEPPPGYHDLEEPSTA